MSRVFANGQGVIPAPSYTKVSKKWYLMLPCLQHYKVQIKG